MTGRRIAVIGLPFFAELAAEGLREAGLDAVYVPRPGRSVPAAIRMVRTLLSARLVYAIGSSAARRSPVDLLLLLRRRVLLHWVGTDVTEARADYAANRLSDRVRRRAAHWADAPWLVDELRPLGIHATDRPLPARLSLGEVTPFPERFRVLIYLAQQPHAAYDVEGTLAVCRALPDIEFAIFGGYTPDPPLSNVTALGYIHDMPPVYRDSAVFLRLVRHDGFSHAVAEALSYGRYAIWNYPFTGVISVADPQSAIAAVRQLYERFAAGSLQPNISGASAVTQRYGWYTLLDEVRSGMDQLLS